MNITEFFQNAKWVGAQGRTAHTFSVVRGHFQLNSIERVTLRVLGLGFFKCYINGQCVNPDTFLPLSSEYEPGCAPEGEVLTAQRIYVPQFDITPFVHAGDNVIALHYGGGWYTFDVRTFGLPKAIYCITAESADGTQYFTSDEQCRVGNGLVSDYYFTQHETQDYTAFTDCLTADFDDRSWAHAVLTEVPNTTYCTTDCPMNIAIPEYFSLYNLEKRTQGEGFSVQGV